MGELLEFVEQAAELTTVPDQSTEDVLISHSATLSLGGGPSPCAALSCRMRRAQELANFAAFYSDRVYIYNFMLDQLYHRNDAAGESTVRKDLYDDLMVLNYLRPLIEAGKVVPLRPPGDRCPRCLMERSLDRERMSRFTAVERHLERSYLENLQIEALYRNGLLDLNLRGPNSLLEHDLWFVLKKIHKFITAMPGLSRRLSEGKGVMLGRESRRKLGIHRRLSREIMKDVVFELALSQYAGSYFLTERSIHLEVLATLSQDPAIVQRNNIIHRYLTAMVPFAETVAPADLLRLRGREEESFIVFRQAFNKMIDDIVGQGLEFSEAHARSLYEDVLAPKLAQLDKKFKAAKRELTRAAAGKVGALAGAITFGISTGLIPSGLATAAKAIGLVKVLADGVESLVAKAKREEAIRSDDLYFLWKVREVGKPREVLKGR